MADYEDGIFSNLPRLKKRRDDDDRRLSPRALLAMNFVPEGPLPPRPRPSGKGGPSVNQGTGPSAPVNTVAPVASGSLTVGSTLSCTTGTWSNSPTGYAYQWLRNGANISGATSSTYLTVTADGGTSVSCQVTASNGLSASTTSNALSIAAAATSVWSAADAAANAMTRTNGGLTFVATNAVWQSIRNSISQTAGKLYVEFKVTTAPSDGNSGFGIASSGFFATSYLGSTDYSFGAFNVGANHFLTGFTSIYNQGTIAPALNDVWAIAVDLSGGKLWLAQNNVWFGSGNPGTGANPMATIASPALGQAFFAAMSVADTAAGAWTLQPTAASQAYAPPSGFTPWG